MRRTMVAVLVLCAAMAGWAVESAPIDVASREFALPKHGKLVLNLPATWKYQLAQPPQDLPPTIKLSPAEGDDFEVLITPLWNFSKDPAAAKPVDVKSLMAEELQKTLPSAVEKTVDLQEFKAKDGTGYYYFMTDKAPKPGEYPYMVRASVVVGELDLSVTVLCRTKDSAGIAQTIKALGDAQQKKD